MASTETLTTVTMPPQSQVAGRPKHQNSETSVAANAIKQNEASRAELGERSADVENAQAKSFTHLRDLEEQLAEAIQTLNDSLARSPTKANISHDEELNRYIVRIADKVSGEIVREIPSEDLLRFARYLEKLKGILFDREV